MLSLYQMNSNDQIVANWKVEKGGWAAQFLSLLLHCFCLCPDVDVSYKLDSSTVVGPKYCILYIYIFVFFK